MLLVSATPFLLNAIMASFKWFVGTNTLSTTGKRGVLAFFALIGALAYGQITGEPVDIDSISSLATIVAEAFVAFLLAHGSYMLFWKK